MAYQSDSLKKLKYKTFHFPRTHPRPNPLNPMKGGLKTSMDYNIEEQYDKIYRYCYMHVRHRQTVFTGLS